MAVRFDLVIAAEEGRCASKQKLKTNVANEQKTLSLIWSRFGSFSLFDYLTASII